MIGGKLTWAIVILEECTVRPIALQTGRREPEKLGGQMLRQQDQTRTPIQLCLPPRKINVGSSVFVRSIKQDSRHMPS